MACRKGKDMSILRDDQNSSEDMWGEIRKSQQKWGTEKWKLGDDGSFGNAEFGLPVAYEVRYCKRKARLGHRLRSYHICQVKNLRLLKKSKRAP